LTSIEASRTWPSPARRYDLRTGQHPSKLRNTRARGWTLTDISPAYHLPHAAGEAWSFTFVPARQLWSLPTTGWR
jgi:hypothetical protein